MNDLSIIGAGKLGTSLGFALAKKGFVIKALSCKRLSSAKESRRIIGQGVVCNTNVEAAKMAQWIMLSVPDDQIEKVAAELCESDVIWRKKFVFHCSGLHSKNILAPVKKKGAVTASVHPIQSFPQKRPLPDVFQNIYFGLEGQTEGLELAKRLVRKLGGKHIILAPEDKPLYHTACTMASNFFVALLDTAFFLFEQMGFEKDQASQILMPLVQGTLQNVKKFNTTEALTGPAARGDENSIRTHLQALRPFPDSYNLYSKITSQILLFAEKEKRISAKKIKALKALLEDE